MLVLLDGETPWVIWPRAADVSPAGGDEDAPAPALPRTATAPWEEQQEALEKAGWRLPTRKESAMDGELVGYNIYVSGHGTGAVKQFYQSSWGPSEHKVKFDDVKFKMLRVKLRRKGNQETPWMVMPGLLHKYLHTQHTQPPRARTHAHAHARARTHNS